MTTYETKHKTFSKQTQKMVKDLMPSAKKVKKVYSNHETSYLIKDSNNKTLGVWMPRICKNGVIKVW